MQKEQVEDVAPIHFADPSFPQGWPMGMVVRGTLGGAGGLDC